MKVFGTKNGAKRIQHATLSVGIDLFHNHYSPTILNQVIDYIQAHLYQDFTLTELAAIANVSPNYFATQFKQAMVITPHQYVIGKRIKKAKKLILEGKDTLAEIADCVGFADQSHLTRHFKRVIGVTPKKFLQTQ